MEWVCWLARVSEEEEGVDGEEVGWKDVSSGESEGRVARGDWGRPVGLGCVDDCIFGVVFGSRVDEVELTKLGGCGTSEVFRDSRRRPSLEGGRGAELSADGCC